MTEKKTKKKEEEEEEKGKKIADLWMLAKEKGRAGD